MTRGGRITMALLATVSMGLWLGGLIMLFMSVSSLFQTYARTTAGLGATAVFKKFEVMQGILAVIALVTTFLATAKGRGRTIAMILLLLAAVAAAGITFGLSPRIDAMRIAGETESDRFRTTHAISMVTYLVVTHLVAAAWVTANLSWLSETFARASRGPGSPAEPAGSTAGR